MEKREDDQITEEQRKRAEANRAAALAKRKAILSLSTHENAQNWNLSKCRKLSPDAHFPLDEQPSTSGSSGPSQRPEKFRARLEICSPDSFSVTPVAVEGFVFPGEDVSLEKLNDCLLNVCKAVYLKIWFQEVSLLLISFVWFIYD